MKKIVATTSATSVGATFVDWSIHFLSGQQTFYNFKQKKWIPVSLNPITTINSHGHQKNHPSGSEVSKLYIDHFVETPGELFTLYPFPLHLDQISTNLNNLTSADWHTLIKKQCDDYNQIFDYCNNQSVKLIYISLDPSQVLYKTNVRSLDRMPFESREANSIEEVQTQLDQTFFGKSIQAWKDLNLENRWDIRERLALCIRPFETPKSQSIHFGRFSDPHLWIDSRSLWYNGNETIKAILDYAELNIDNIRYAQWQPIYQQWQQKQFKLLEFTYNYKHIVDCIVNNWYYPIDLTFDQEVLIQHCLIYQHGLNLKTWNLDKFPSNTQELHKLLEPNIHPL